MDEQLNETGSIDEQEILEKLTNLEDKLNELKEFSEQSEKLRSVRKKKFENLGIAREQNISHESRTDSKRVQFTDDQKSESRDRGKASVNFISKAQKSNSLYNLLTGLNTWQAEVESKKSKIEMLKSKRLTVTELEEIRGYEDKIKGLELENDELSDNILHFILQNMNEGKEEYQDLILHLEDENKAMEDTIFTLSDQVKFLKENNKALMLENDNLRQNKFGIMKTLSTEDMDQTYRKSVFSKKSSAMLSEANLLYTYQNIKISPSVQLILDLDLEDKLSLDKVSQDSFTLDNQIANWKLDDNSMHDHLKRIEREHHEMEVIEMKLNLVKRYVRKHGVKQINKDTFIDPYQKV